MISVYLFDWGDTLMVDFPGVTGKMCNWEHVEAIDGAVATLARLSASARIFVATGAAESTVEDIERAFERVGLHAYISGYFCKSNLGVAKGTPEFLQTIVEKVDVPVSEIAMVGDSVTNDIIPAIEVGIHPIWLTNTNQAAPSGARKISRLDELLS